MTSELTIEAIAAHLDEQPADWVARLQLADLMEEGGYLLDAKLQRWLAQYKKTPHKSHHITPYMRTNPTIGWRWNWRYVYPNDVSWLGGAITFHLEYHDYGYDSRVEAERDLLMVLESMGWPAPEVEE